MKRLTIIALLFFLLIIAGCHAASDEAISQSESEQRNSSSLKTISSNYQSSSDSSSSETYRSSADSTDKLFESSSLVSSTLTSQTDKSSSQQLQSPDSTSSDNDVLQFVHGDFSNMISFCALIDDSCIYMGSDEDYNAVYYRYYIKDNKTVTLGKIENFNLSSDDMVLVEGILYFYANVWENNESSSNVLFGIDLSENSLLRYENNDGSLAGIFTSKFKDDIITLKNIVSDNTIKTFIDVFDTDSKTWKQKIINYVNSETYKGSAIFGFYGNEKNLYILHDDCLGGVGNTHSTLKVYDRNMDEIQSISLSQDLCDYIFDSRIKNMSIFGDYVYMINFSNNAFLGKIENDTLVSVMKEQDLQLADNLSDPDNPMLYVRRSNRCYFLNIGSESVSSIDLQLKEDYAITYLLADQENVFLWCSAKDKPDYMYYLKRDSLNNVILPCE